MHFLTDYEIVFLSVWKFYLEHFVLHDSFKIMLPAAALQGFFFSEHSTHFRTFIAHVDQEATSCFFRDCSWELIRVTSRGKQKIKRLPFYLHYSDHLLFGHFRTSFNMWIQEMVTSHLIIGRYPWNACGSGVVVFRHLLFSSPSQLAEGDS